MRKQLTLIEIIISQLPVIDQIKTNYAISNGFELFLKKCKKHTEANWDYFTKHLIKEARQVTGLSEKETKNLIKMCDYFLVARDYNETLSLVPGFPKKPLQPYAFTARHADPKGLFQVHQED